MILKIYPPKEDKMGNSENKEKKTEDLFYKVLVVGIIGILVALIISVYGSGEDCPPKPKLTITAPGR